MKEQKTDLKEMNKDNNQGEIVIYQTDDGDTKIDVRFVDETVLKIFLKRASLKKIQLFGNSEQFKMKARELSQENNYITISI